MKTQPSSPESANPPDLTKKYRASLSVVQARLRRVRRRFEALELQLASRRRSGEMSEGKDNELKIHNALVEFEKPADVVKDPTLSQTEKKKALENLEQDARQLLTASNEGMAPQSDHLRKHEPKLDEVVKAKDRIGEKPQHKPAH